MSGRQLSVAQDEELCSQWTNGWHECVPVHSGRHLSPQHEGSADGLLRSKLNNLETAYQRDNLNDNQVLERLGNIEKSMRNALTNIVNIK